MKSERSVHFARGLATGLLLLFVNIAYTAISVPLGLFYLGKEQFGVWALAQQVAGYFLLLDFGMTAAVSRLIADQKSALNHGEYGSLLLTGCWILGIQSFSILLLGTGFSVIAPSLFGVPAPLAGDFQNCLFLLAVISALSLVSRSVGIPLWAFQRMDVINSCMAVNLVLSLLAMWLGLKAGLGVLSLALAGLPGIFWTAGRSLYVCTMNSFYPSRKCWGRPSLKIFRQCFAFAKDVFLIGIGTQLTNASQIMVISKALGLEAAAVYSVGTKLYTLAYQLCTKVVQNSIAGLTDIYVQGSPELFRKRVRDLFCVVGALAAASSCFLILLNTDLIRIWTAHQIVFGLPGDVLLGFLLIPVVFSIVGIEAFISMGFLHTVRFLRLAEGLLVICGCFWVASLLGLPGMLMIAFLVGLLGLVFCAFKIRVFLSGMASFIFGLLGKAFIVLALVSLLKILLDSVFLDVFARLSLCAFVWMGVGIWIVKLFISHALRREIFLYSKRFFTFQRNPS